MRPARTALPVRDPEEMLSPVSDDSPTKTPVLSILRRAELAAGWLIVAGLVFVHWRVMRSTGALWRDEVSSVNVAALPTFAEMVRNHYWDSFPILWCTVLRGWIAVGMGDSDL